MNWLNDSCWRFSAISWTDQTVGVNCRVSLCYDFAVQVTRQIQTRVINADQVISEMLGLPNEASVIADKSHFNGELISWQSEDEWGEQAGQNVE